MTNPAIAVRLLAFARVLIAEEISMSVEELLCFLTVAASPGISVGELAQETGLPQSSVSRHLKRLSARSLSSKGKFGPVEWELEIGRADPLIEQSVHTENAKQKALNITCHGKTLLERFERAVNGGA